MDDGMDPCAFFWGCSFGGGQVEPRAVTSWVVVSHIFWCSLLFGEDYHYDSYFSNGLVQPPTSKTLMVLMGFMNMCFSFTTWKFNSSPLRLYRAPKGQSVVFQASFFRGELLNFGRGKTDVGTQNYTFWGGTWCPTEKQWWRGWIHLRHISQYRPRIQ